MTSQRLSAHRSPAAGRLVSPDSSEWDSALRQIQHDTYHLPGYARVEATLSSGSACAFFYEDTDQVLLLPLVLRPIGGGSRSDVTSPYGYPGPIASSDDELFWGRALQSLLSTLRTAGVVSCFVRLHPWLPAPLSAFQVNGLLVQHGQTVSIDLRPPVEAIVAGFRANHRRQIARARRTGHRVLIDCWHRLDEFIDIYYETMRRVGASSYYSFPRDHFQRLRTALGEHIHLILVEGPADGSAVAGGLFLESCGILQYHLGATRTSALPEQPTKLMFEEACRWGRNRGDSALHLGAGLGGNDDTLFHFKAGFSGRRHAFHTWRVVVDDDAYEALASAGATEDRTKYFPAYRLLARDLVR
jgi:hypothetical protein